MVRLKPVSENTITLKSSREIAAMSETARRLKVLMADLTAFTKPGVTAKEVDVYAAKRCKELELASGALGYPGTKGRFPGYICVSINEVVVHGIPGPQRIEAGDIVSLDVAVSHKGYFADTCVTLPMGEVSEEKRELLEVCEGAMYAGIAEARAGNRLSDIGHAIQEHTEAHGMNVVRDFVGHGIGRAMHEAPQVPHYGVPGRGALLRPGMVICIEPQITVGSPEIRFLKDGWTAVTVDGSLSAHFEHTVVVTTNGPQILTSYRDN
ncbi:MAG: methionyl aminopeptidase [Chloroflexota bacterium]|jgi:methionyl aminopeptidase|nr:methionyl aminopeptidase [Chloroflexota bacterium]